MATGLRIEVGADVQEAVKALRDFAQEAEKSGGIVSDSMTSNLGKATSAIDKVKAAATKLNATLPKTSAAFKQVSPSSNQATQSLINLSRVAQDAPFGFIGIANNLNPLLESFQRLKATTGTTGGALKALAGSLTGAGGIGLALSVVSSALIFFGDNLFKSGNAASASKRELDALNATLAESKKRIDDVGASLEFRSQLGSLSAKLFGGTDADLTALARDVIATRNALFDIEPEIRAAQDLVVKANRTFLDNQNDDTKKALDEAEKNLADAFKKRQDLTEKSQLLELKINIQKIEDDKEAAKKRLEIQKKLNAELIKQAKFLEDRFIFADTFTVFDTNSQEIRKARRILNDFFTKPVRFKVPFEPLLSEPEKAAEEAGTTFEQMFAKELADMKLPPVQVDFTLAQALIDEKKIQANRQALAAAFSIDISESPLTQLQKQSIAAAKAIDGVLTPAFQDLFGAILQGENPIKAFFTGLGQAVTQLIQKLIQAALQAAILSVIFPGGFGAGQSAVKGFGSIFKNILGFAQGGIVSGPTLALIGEGIGTSRSNPEIVAPLDQLRAIMGDVVGDNSGGIAATVRLRGKDQVLQFRRSSKSQRRTTGR